MIDPKDVATFLPLREWLIARREEMGYTQSELARRIGLRRPDQLKAWEEGRHTPTMRWLALWCQALDSDLTVVPWELTA